AVSALSSVWGPRANPWYSPLVEDPDDGVRIAAVSALRKHGGLDREAVRRIGRVLTNALSAGAEAKVAAAAALGDTAGPARAAAAAPPPSGLLPRAAPRPTGFFTKRVTADVREDDTVVVTMARVLLSIGGPEGAKAVQVRAGKSGGELKRQLQGLVDARPAPR